MSRYIYDPNLESERDRIQSLQAATDPETIRVLESIGISPGWRCLEVGGGGGSIARWLAERVGPEGGVVVTDLNTRFLDELEVPNIEVRQHDVVNDDLEVDTYDLVHSRFLLEHLPERDEVLDKLIAAARPGGWIVMEDVDFQSAISADPEQMTVYPPELAEAVAKVRGGMLTGMRANGIDPEYGRRLPAELEKRGLLDVEARGVFRTVRGGSPQARIGRIGLAQMKERFISQGVLTEDDFEKADRALSDPGTLSTAPVLMSAWGRVPG